MLIRVYLIPFAKQFVRTLNVNIIYYLFRNEKRAASYDSFQGRYSAAATAAGDNTSIMAYHFVLSQYT